MKCLKCGSDKNVDPRLELCEKCLQINVWEAMRIFAPVVTEDALKMLEK
jgi:hypothetical protein